MSAPNEEDAPMRLLCPTDFSESADRAQRRAVGLARALGAELVLLHVATDPPPVYNEGFWGLADVPAFVEGQRKWATDMLQSRVDTIVKDGTAARAKVTAGVPVDEIVRAAAEEAVAFIVMGTHGRGQLDRLLLGSVADRVIRLAPCPVMTVREGIEN
jgi:nucleotide-binding universal stress UspA family protein